MAKNIYGAIALTGGGTGALDSVDGAGLADQDMALAYVQGDKVYHYVLNATSGAAESSPDIIAPDANAGDKRWILHDIHGFSDKLNKAVDLTLGTNLDYTGQTATMTAGEALAFGDVCYLKDDGKLWKAKGDDAATMPVMAMAGEVMSAGDSAAFILPGSNQFVRNDAWSWTIGGSIYVSEATGGAMTQTQPDQTGEQVQYIGQAYTATVMIFNPQPLIIEIA